MPGYVSLPGSARTLMPNSRPAGPVNLSEIASLTVRVRSKDAGHSLSDMAYDLASQPLSERNYLTREELEKGHGADPADLDKIEHFAQQHSLTVVHRNAAERHVVVKGKLGDLLAAFHADVQIYHHAGGTYRGRRGEIGIPDDLKQIITGVFGFDTRPKHRSPSRVKASALSGPGGSNGLSPADFAARYKFPTKQDNVTLDGAGQTIAIIELGGGYRNSDLQMYFKELKQKGPKVSAVSVDHAGNSPSTPDSDDGEVMLDIEVAGTVIPNANIVVYFAPNDGDKGFLDAISAAVNDKERKPSVISISWGGPEDGSDQQGMQAFHEVFAAAATLGVTICAASGDHGTADLDSQHWDGKIHVNHPACDDLVLGCGGTQIENNVDVVWNDGTPFDVNAQGGGGWSSGGGVSTVFKLPPYQQNAKVPVSIDTKQPGRGVPDIAMSATNYFTRVDSFEGASGGTSAVAPLMAALVARLNQALTKNVGFLNPALYQNAGSAAFVDVTVGTNTIKNGPPGYNAGPGWDASTGLGTPVGVELLKVLQSPAAVARAAE